MTLRDSALHPPPSQDTLLQRFGATLRSYRQQRGLSQQALAASTGIRRAYISEIELGKRNIAVLTLLHITYSLRIPSAWPLAQVDPRAVRVPPMVDDPVHALGARNAGIMPEATRAPQRGGPVTLLPLLGATIRQARQQQGLSQQGLATKTGLSLTYIIEIENGHRNLSVLSLVRIAEALELAVAHLLRPLDPFHTPPPLA